MLPLDIGGFRDLLINFSYQEKQKQACIISHNQLSKSNTYQGKVDAHTSQSPYMPTRYRYALPVAQGRKHMYRSVATFWQIDGAQDFRPSSKTSDRLYAEIRIEYHSNCQSYEPSHMIRIGYTGMGDNLPMYIKLCSSEPFENIKLVRKRIYKVRPLYLFPLSDRPSKRVLGMQQATSGLVHKLRRGVSFQYGNDFPKKFRIYGRAAGLT